MTSRDTNGAERHPCEHRADRPHVSFVARVESRSRSALLRAVALAVSERADLRVVLCAPFGRSTSRMLFPHRAMDAIRTSAREARQIELARAWALRLAPDASVEVEWGDVSTVAVRAGSAPEVCLLVVAPSDLDRCRDAVWVATESGVPVLVARPTIGWTTVLAATDMSDLALPVVRGASALARNTGAHVVAVHNTPLFVIEPMTPYGNGRAVGPTPEDLRVKADRLAEAVRKHDEDAESVHVSALTAVRAVLDTATSLSADIVAVGARRRRWLERVLFGSVAETIVERCDASVLVMPIGTGSSDRAVIPR